MSALRRICAAVLFVGTLIFAHAAPAHADPPELQLVPFCGGTVLQWDTGTIGGSESWATTVLRNDDVVEQFEMHERGQVRYGASDGDIFFVRRAGLPEVSLVYEMPADCGDIPQLSISVVNECFALKIDVTNASSAVAENLRIYTRTNPDGTALPDVSNGTASVYQALSDGETFVIAENLAGPGTKLWIIGTYEKPEGCGPGSITATFTDNCDSIAIAIANSSSGVIRSEVIIGDIPVFGQSIAPHGTATLTTAATIGTPIVVRDAVIGTEYARHISGASCPSASPSIPPSAEPSTQPSVTASSNAGGASTSPSSSPTASPDTLPVTGPQAAGLLAAGGVLLAAGLALFVLSRRRPSTTRTDQ